MFAPVGCFSPNMSISAPKRFPTFPKYFVSNRVGWNIYVNIDDDRWLFLGDCLKVDVKQLCERYNIQNKYKKYNKYHVPPILLFGR